MKLDDQVNSARALRKGRVTIAGNNAMRSRALRRAVESASASITCAESLESRMLFTVTVGADGWTSIARSGPGKTIYVSATGNDANTGLSIASPLKTLTKARSLLTDYSGDWLLLKRGDVFQDSLLQWNKSGQSADNPMLIGTYGDPTAARPQLLTGINNGFTTGKTSVNNLYVIGLSFDADARDPDSPTFVGPDGGSYGIQSLAQVNNLNFEDTVFDSYKFNVSIQAIYGTKRATNVSFRRCEILDAYNNNGRSQGFYAEYTDNLTLFQNVFDHNGWSESTKVTNSGASTQNHNVYIHSSCTGLDFQQNISSNASSHGLQARPGGIVKDNLFFADPIGLSFGLVNGSTVKAGGVTGEVSGNLFFNNRSIGSQGRGWGMEIGNTAVGGNVIVHDNIFTQDSQKLYAAIQLNYGFNGDNAENSVGLNDVTFENNIVYKWYEGLSTSANFNSSPTATGQTALNNITVRNNDFETLADSRIILLNHAFNGASEHWSGNTYWDDSPASGWFTGQNNQLMSLDTWRQIVEPTAVQLKRDYIDPDRTVGDYSASLGGLATNDAIIALVRQQDKRNWNPKYAATAINAYIRDGFRSDITAPTAVLQAADVTAAGGSTHTFNVTYSDDGTLKTSTIDSSDIRVIGPTGFDAAVSLMNVVSGTGSAKVATYQILAPGGSWDLADDGVYNVFINAGQVTDTTGKAVPAGQIGSFRSRTDQTPPTAVGAIPLPLVIGATNQKVMVTYTDNGSIDATTLDSDDIRVRGPNGFDVPANFESVTPSGNGSPRIASYSITPPGGDWDGNDQGLYTIYINSTEVADTSGNFITATDIGTFTNGPVVIVVDTNEPPVAALSAPNLLAATTGRYRFTVNYSDSDGVDFNSIDGVDVRVNNPAKAYGSTAALVSKVASTDGKSVLATYGVSGPGGTWDSADNGPYTITLFDAAVSDSRGAAMAAATLGSFNVGIPTPANLGPAPTLTSAQFTQSSSGDKLLFRFSEDVSRTLDATDFVVVRTKVGSIPLKPTDLRLSWNSSRKEVTITFPTMKNRQLQAANWQVTLVANGILDVDSLALDGNKDGRGGDNYVFSFRRK